MYLELYYFYSISLLDQQQLPTFDNSGMKFSKALVVLLTFFGLQALALANQRQQEDRNIMQVD